MSDTLIPNYMNTFTIQIFQNINFKYQFQNSKHSNIYHYIRRQNVLVWNYPYCSHTNIFLPCKDEKKAQSEYWQDKINHEESREDT